MNKVWGVLCILAGVLFGCLGSFSLLVWFASLIDGVEWGGLVLAVVCVSASIVSLLVARQLWRSDED
jgi:hypothetical protein